MYEYENSGIGNNWAAKKALGSLGSNVPEAVRNAWNEAAKAESGETDYLQLIRYKINKMYDKVKNNETEETFQIGAGLSAVIES